MHASAYKFASEALYPVDVTGRRVVEAGAYNYNGSVRDAIEAMGPASYVGTDAQPGPGVDLAVAAERLPAHLGAASADVVISTEMLEHAEDWQAAMCGLTELLVPGGVLLLTTRGPGFPYHPHPGDFHRFTVDLMDAILAALGLHVMRLEADPDPNSPGVLVLAMKPAVGWAGVDEAALKAIEVPAP
ncbi:MAG: methyltransferase domain-containing protein [Streptosporangiaceae bacterium]